jgi:hypothetical protein
MHGTRLSLSVEAASLFLGWGSIALHSIPVHGGLACFSVLPGAYNVNQRRALNATKSGYVADVIPTKTVLRVDTAGYMGKNIPRRGC